MADVERMVDVTLALVEGARTGELSDERERHAASACGTTLAPGSPTREQA